ncbi:hypothetical protein PR048_024459 [Dryococelus australis]|uniref:Uncharacterized protein n=1 Tax=Dryococelus australis TaxID=614101 RepID=A0ABQ9GNR5_9NEOP|nr:hypothetical protein PR048_024459 [Dryococelus australis]
MVRFCICLIEFCGEFGIWNCVFICSRWLSSKNCSNTIGSKIKCESNSREHHEKPLDCNCVTIWCRVESVGIIGSYVLKRKLSLSLSLGIDMLQRFRTSLIELKIRNVWFQQNGATTHIAIRSHGVPRQLFPGCLISLRGKIPWPARWPYLTPCDFFSGGFLKAEVCKHRPRTLPVLRNTIRGEIGRNPPEMLARVAASFRTRDFSSACPTMDTT